MSNDPSSIERFARTIAEALAEIVDPLQAETTRLRAEVAQLRALVGAAAAAVKAAPPVVAAAPALPAAAPRVAPQPARAATAEAACRVPRCPAPVLAKELCETHYRIMRRLVTAGRKFDPAKQQAVELRQPARGCEDAGCVEAHYAKGLCRRHYMAARARLRTQAQATRKSGRGAAAPAVPAPRLPLPAPVEAPPRRDDALAVGASLGGLPSFTFDSDTSSQDVVAMPTAEVVARVVQQNRGNLWKVAEVLGRNRRTLMELLEKLDLMEQVVSVRNTERQRILTAPLKEKLGDLLFREKVLEDLGCLKEVDESARQEVQLRCAQLAKTNETQEDVFKKLAAECGLEESGLKRLVWRYNLRRQLRGLKPARTAAVVRSRV